MKNLKISTQVIILIAATIIALIVVGVVGLVTAKYAEKGAISIRDDSLAGVKILAFVRNEYMRSRVNMSLHVLAPEDEEKDRIEKLMQKIESSIANSLKDYEKLLSNEEDKTLFEASRRDVQTYFNTFWEEVVPLSRKKELEASIAQQRGDLRQISLRLTEDFDKHIAFKEKSASNYSTDVITSVSNAINVIMATIIVATLAMGVIGYLMLNAIQGSLNNIRVGVDRIESDLDFTLRIEVQRQDEIGITAQALNRLLDKLQETLKTIMARAETVACSASRMATTSNQIAAASHQQSEAASNVAATVEQMTVSINHVGDRAQEADSISSESGTLASSGEAIIGRMGEDINKVSITVSQAAERIKRLAERGQQISTVVAVIKEVADQTNLLALNAAIEAARAGEHGRGFAVVADEVRKLAERTSASTQEIAQTIGSMRSCADEAVATMESVIHEVNQGVESAREASQAINKIGVGSQNAVEMVEEISSSIREQASAMTSIAQQVERIAQMSEESSAAAGDSSLVAKDLDGLASEMKQIVSAYRL